MYIYRTVLNERGLKLCSILTMEDVCTICVAVTEERGDAEDSCIVTRNER